MGAEADQAVGAVEVPGVAEAAAVAQGKPVLLAAIPDEKAAGLRAAGVPVVGLGGGPLMMSLVVAMALRRCGVRQVVLMLPPAAKTYWDQVFVGLQFAQRERVRCFAVEAGVDEAGLRRAADAVPAVEWVVRQIFTREVLATPLERDSTISTLLTAAKDLSALDADAMMRAAAEILGMPPAVLMAARAETSKLEGKDEEQRIAKETANKLQQLLSGEGPDGRGSVVEILTAGLRAARAASRGLPPRVRAADLTAEEAPPQNWVLGQALPAREVGLLVGGDGSGKSLLALLAAVSTAGGIPWAGGLLPAPPKTGRVVYVAGEDDTDEIHRRLRAIAGALVADCAGAEDRSRLDSGFGQIDVVPLDGHPMPLLAAGRQQADPEETSWVEFLQELVEGARLLILDPLVMFHAINENDNQHMDRIIRCVQRIVRTAPECAALVVHHAGQGSVRDGADDAMVARGATALHSAARAVFAVRRLNHEEEQRAAAIGDPPWRWRAVRGPKISRSIEKPVAYVRFTDGGVPLLATLPALKKDGAKPTKGQLVAISGKKKGAGRYAGR